MMLDATTEHTVLGRRKFDLDALDEAFLNLPRETAQEK